MTGFEQDQDASRATAGEISHVSDERSMTLAFNDSTWTALCEEASREGLAIEELITFSVLYYLADIDSGRISRQVSMSPYPGGLPDQLVPRTRITDMTTRIRGVNRDPG